jgi:uncharacterized protein
MQVVADGSRFMLKLDEGEDLFATLGQFALSQSIRAAAVVMGIGQVRSATIAFWNGKEYAPKEITTPHELVSLQGTIAEADGQPSVHLHAALGGPDHEILGGHLMRAVIGILGEIRIDVFPGRVFGRARDEDLGLRVLDLETGPAP